MDHVLVEPVSDVSPMDGTHPLGEGELAGFMKTQTKRALAFVLRRIYGVRGAIKPPLGPYNTPLKSARYKWWKIVSSLYKWSGLPEEWHRHFSRAGFCQHKADEGAQCQNWGHFYMRSINAHVCMDHMIEEIIDQRLRANPIQFPKL